jgi:hypothetical protein
MTLEGVSSRILNATGSSLSSGIGSGTNDRCNVIQFVNWSYSASVGVTCRAGIKSGSAVNCTSIVNQIVFDNSSDTAAGGNQITP